MLKYLVLVVLPFFGILVSGTPYFYSSMKPCPSVISQKNFDINQMMGEWNLALLLMDEQFDEYEDDATCVRADFQKVNDTTFKQLWYINSLQFGFGAIAELPITITESGTWESIDPLGGHLQIRIARASPKSHISMTFCGAQHGKHVHLWTAIVTREIPITQIQLLELSAELLVQGFNINDSKIIKFSRC